MSSPLGLRPVINASATLTALGGSLLAPPVIAAMAEAAGHFVDLLELQTRVGERIAARTGNEAVYVSSGAAAGITLAVAACMAGTGHSETFPGLGGIDRTEVVLFHSQRNGYDYAVRQTGAHVVEAGATPDSLRAALSPRTACVLWFAGAHYADDAPPIEDVVSIGHAAGVPVLVDAAAQVPPISSLWHFTREVGADAAIFSGGKGLRGPQSSGLVLGRQAIIDGCRAHGSPHHAIGRGMKVGKEELAGLLAAVEWSLDRDEPALLDAYEATVAGWLKGLTGLPGVSVERGYPSEAGQPHGRAIVTLDPASGWTRDELVDALWTLDPRIAVGVVGTDSLALNPQTLEPGEDTIVLDALLHHLRSRDTT
jgi:L-seryl-tRNA(Ser) seleniumtransferase